MAKAQASSKSRPLPVHDDQWRIPDVLWERIDGFYRHGYRIVSAATIPASKIAGQWTPSFSYSGPAVSGGLLMPPASAPTLRPTAGSRNGPRPASSSPSGLRVWRNMTN